MHKCLRKLQTTCNELINSIDKNGRRYLMAMWFLDEEEKGD